MSKDDWDNFSIKIDSLISSNQILSHVSDNHPIRNDHHLNAIWNHLRDCIIRASSEHIPTKQISTNSHHHLSKELANDQKDIHLLNKIYKKIYRIKTSATLPSLW